MSGIPGTDTKNTPPTTIAVVAAVVALVAIAGAALVFSGDTDAATQRLVIFLGIIATTVTGLVGLLRADQAASRLNGGLEARIQAAVFRAHAERRATDPGGIDGPALADAIPSSSPPAP